MQLLRGIASIAVGFVALAATGHAQGLGNFCPIGTCDITNPNYVNVYWDSSLAQWDIDAAANTPDLGHDHIDHLTEALINSKYFADLTQYSVTSVTMGQSISAAGCIAAPNKLDSARSSLPTLVNCLLGLFPSLNKDNTILAVYVPPQSMTVPGICQGKGEAAEHGQYGTSVGVLFIPTNKACGNLAGIFGSTTHEMVEATTDPNPPSPTGWKVGTTGDFYGQEIADVCQSLKFSDVGFLFGGVANQWSNSANTCVTGFTKTAPTITTASACGAGQGMTMTLKGSFGGVPWDLAAKKFGTQTLYLRARIAHGGKMWGAGDPDGLPSDLINNGKPDVVHFGASGVTWAPSTITASGFDANYGKTMSNGAVAEVSSGDPITINVALNDTGQFATTKIFAPNASQILNLAVAPIGGDPFIFVNAKADVSGTLADAGKCGVQKQTVNLNAWQGSVSPWQVGTSGTGAFSSNYFASSVAGMQNLDASLAGNGSVKASVSVPVHPILTSISPSFGPVAGGQQATLSGDGFDSGNTTVDFGGAAAKVGNVVLQSIQLTTPKSPLAGDGDGTVDVEAVVNTLNSVGIPYQYVLPGKPYIAFKSTDCKTHYIVVTVYDDNAQPVNAPIHLTANYAAYFSNGQWVSSMNTTTGVWVQVDKGGPFTATNTNKNLSNTASFPVLPEVVCDNVKLITKVDWHMFEKGDPLNPVEISQLNPGVRVVGGNVKKVVVWSKTANVKDATTYVLDPTGTAQGGGIRVSTVGKTRLRNVIHGGIFLGGGAKTESAPGTTPGNVRLVRFAGPAFSIMAPGQQDDRAVRLGRTLRLTFGLPEGASDPNPFHIVHLTFLGGQPTWIEDGTEQSFPYKTAITRTIEESGTYALVEVVGRGNEEPQQQQQQQEQQEQKRQPEQASPTQPQSAPPNSTVLVPSAAFPGGVLTGVVIGPDDKPVPNTPVEIAGGVPADLTGVVVGEEPPPSPCSSNDPACQPGGQQTPPSHPPVDCASLLGNANAPSTPAGAVPAAGKPTAVTDASGRFAVCVPPDAPQVNAGLPGGTATPIPAVQGTPQLPNQPPSFFQPSQRISIIGVLRHLKVDQNGRSWPLPTAQTWSPNGDQTITAFQTPRDLEPGPADLSYTGSDSQRHQIQGTVFRLVRASLDRARLRSEQGASFEYVVQFAGQPGKALCVDMHLSGPVVLVQAPPETIPIDAGGMGTFGGKIRATQVTAGAVVPFDLTPNIHVCGQ